jgi:multiphosphoryl transfer protein
MGGTVGLVLVSHSAALAAGLRDLVAQMATGVPIVAAGGDPDGGLGTSPDAVAAALTAADSGAGVVVVYDLGSARMSAELAGEFVDPDLAARIRIVDTPFVEGALAAGTAACGGQDLAAVADAARQAAIEPIPPTDDTTPPAADQPAPPADAGETVPQANASDTVSPAAAEGTAPQADIGETVPQPDAGEAVSQAGAREAVSPAAADGALPQPDAGQPVPRADAAGAAVPPASAGAAVPSASAGGTVPPADVGEIVLRADGGGAVSPVAADGAVPAADAGETVVLVDPAGLHARPAAAVVRALAGLDARAWLSVPGGGSASAASLTGLLRLAAPAGTEVRVSAGGPDAAAAVRRIVAALSAAPDEPVPVVVAERRTGPVPAAPGRAVGALRRPVPGEVPVPDEEFAGMAAERERLDAALRRVRGALAGGGIAGAHRTLLDDPELTGTAYRGIDAGMPAARAWWQAVEAARSALSTVDDPLIASRAADVADVGGRVLGELTGHPVRLAVPAGAVLLADDLPPSLVTALAEQGAAAFVLRAGGARSHAAVLARAAGVPMVVAAGDRLDAVPDGTPVLVDGDTGELLPDPPEQPERPAPIPVVAGPVLRPDGTPLRIAANIGSAADARAATAAGADGVGLLRTELLFTGRAALPDEDEQVAWLTGILAACPPGPVVVRTMDLGGDKPVPALHLDPVRHGFLGERGLRLCLARPALFRSHLRAVLRAAAVRPVELMFPFVTHVDEVRAARAALDAAAASLTGVEYGAAAAIGMMVEIPVAALDIAPFLPYVDFLSVGSNDLAQYLGAADRTLDTVDAAYRAAEQQVPRLVADLVAAAGDTPVAVCGDLAGDPAYAARFRRAGVAELSMAPPLVPRVRAALAG